MDALSVLIGLTVVRLVLPVGLLLLAGEWVRTQQSRQFDQR
jgi:hypothetical protein